MIGDLFIGLGVLVLSTATGGFIGSFAAIDKRLTVRQNNERFLLGLFVGSVAGFGIGAIIAGLVLS